MAKIRNACLLAAAALITCTALATRIPLHLVGYVPENLDVGQVRSDIEGRELAVGLPPRTLEAFASGEFQEGFESFASDALPFRTFAMFASASLQSAGIEAAARLFGYDVAPTYYGSERLYVASRDAVTYLPAQNDAYYANKLAEFARMLAGAAARYPQKRFVVYVVQGYQEPAVNPAYDLMSDPYLPESAVQTLRSALSECPNVSVLTDSYDSLEAYYREFYRSDHHWNIVGALRGYNTIASELGLEQVDLDGLELHEVADGLSFIGATSRWGRRIVRDAALDAGIDYSTVTYQARGQTFDGNDHLVFEQYDPQGVRYAFYDAYYNSVPDGPIEGPGRGRALLVSNSYGGALQRQLATQYSLLWKSVALWPGYEGSGLDDLLSQSGATDVVFVANPTDYMNIVDKQPGFFG